MATTQDPLTAAGNTASTVKDKISDAASQLKNTASEYGRTAADQINRNVHSAAGALESTASKLRSQAQTGQGGRVSDIAQNAATKLDATANAMRNFDTQQMLGQAESWARQNPGLAIGGALAIGFFIGMTLRSSDRSYNRGYSSNYDY